MTHHWTEDQKVEITVQPLTYLVFREVAESQQLAVEHLIEQEVYRHAATMSGWPGALGTRIRQAIRSYLHPLENGEEEVPF